MTTLSERLREEREKKGLNQAAFAAVGGVGRSAQINYEKGERYPDAQYLEAIAKIGCDIQFIITGEPAVAKLTSDEIKLLDSFRNSDLKIKAAAMAVLDSDLLISHDEKSKSSMHIGVIGSIGTSITSESISNNRISGQGVMINPSKNEDDQ